MRICTTPRLVVFLVYAFLMLYAQSLLANDKMNALRERVAAILAHTEAFPLTDCSEARLLLEANNLEVTEGAEACILDEYTHFWALKVSYKTETGTDCMICTFDYDGLLLDKIQIPVYEVFAQNNSNKTVLIDDGLTIKTSFIDIKNPLRTCYKALFQIQNSGEITEVK